MLEHSGETLLAAKLLGQVIEMCSDAPGMRPHLARALWFLASLETKIGGDEDTVAELTKRARTVRDLIDEREAPDEDSGESFMRLVSWMLW
ncbi:hypothetical protein QBC46DRAFT_391323 [Diplogelasinospora grovesii]|uniref:Uncharacterized protein n=1 Tax=Diplogelasinospora grovesii TaxID=303347 RepID=A0AAN6N3M5_9PEZI|nr:hypothetical protein QBC46DRAFT_391323 [Diplogelasinospora grovesii]